MVTGSLWDTFTELSWTMRTPSPRTARPVRKAATQTKLLRHMPRVQLLGAQAILVPSAKQQFVVCDTTEQ